MIKNSITGLFTLLVLLIFSTSPAFGQEQIVEYTTTGTVSTDRSISVDEKIIYDFGDRERQGIVRVIPMNGIGKIQLEAVLLNGYPVEYQIEDDSPLQIRIGTEGMFISGEQVYFLRYRLVSAVPYYSRMQLDEMYWNMLGAQWDVPVQQFSGALLYPEKVGNSITNISCFVGEYSSQDTCEYRQDTAGLFVTRQNLDSNQGVTIAVGVRPGIFDSPGLIAEYRHWIDQGMSVVVAILLISSMYAWWSKFGRDIPVKRPLVRQFTPPNGFHPAEVARVAHLYPRSSHVAGVLIDLARRGYLKIEESKKGIWGTTITLRQHQKPDKNLKEYERIFVEALFLNREYVTTDQLKQENFSTHIQTLHSNVYDQELAGLFVRKPGILVGTGIVIGSVILGTGILALVFSWIWIGISCLISGIAWIGISFLMPKRTLEGAKLYQYILGFEHYMNVAEKHRMEFQEKEQLFFELLPYAIALGIVTKWAKAFDDLELQSPDWYQGSNLSTFSAVTFASQLSSNMSSFVVQSGGASSSGSSGGGFSGGGVGGGGGGSW